MGQSLEDIEQYQGPDFEDNFVLNFGVMFLHCLIHCNLLLCEVMPWGYMMFVHVYRVVFDAQKTNWMQSNNLCGTFYNSIIEHMLLKIFRTRNFQLKTFMYIEHDPTCGYLEYKYNCAFIYLPHLHIQ